MNADSFCPDCATITGGRCWRHSVTVTPLGPITLPSGWVCPKCQRVWGPTVQTCQPCSPPASTTLTTVDLAAIDPDVVSVPSCSVED